MHPSLVARAGVQGGIFTRRQALAAGYSEREIRTRTGPRGDWVPVRRGVYAERASWDALADQARYGVRVRAVHLSSRCPAVASHASAAALLGLPLRPGWLDLVHVTRPSGTGSRVEGGVKRHRAAHAPEDVVSAQGVPVLALPRTALDIAREHGFEDGVVAADAALQRGATKDQMRRALHAMQHWSGVSPARAALEAADAGAQTIGETLLRLMVIELGIGVPETQFVITDGRRRAEIDLRVRRHLFEFDGKVKYLGREQGGVAERSASEVVWREKQREDWVRNHDGGYGMSRVVWAELLGRARERTKQRLMLEFLQSERRYGHLG